MLLSQLCWREHLLRIMVHANKHLQAPLPLSLASSLMLYYRG